MNKKEQTQEQLAKLEVEVSKLRAIIDSSEESAEELFLEMFNGCEIKLNNRFPSSVFYKKNNEIWFEQDRKHRYFWCEYSTVWSIFKCRFNWNDQQIQTFIKSMLDKHLGLGELTPNNIRKYFPFDWKDI